MVLLSCQPNKGHGLSQSGSLTLKARGCLSTRFRVVNLGVVHQNDIMKIIVVKMKRTACVLSTNKRSFLNFGPEVLFWGDSVMSSFSRRDFEVWCSALVFTKDIKQFQRIDVIRNGIAPLIVTFNIEMHGSWIPINIAGEDHMWE